MKSILITVIILASLGGGLWWKGAERRKEIDQQKEQQRLAVEQAKEAEIREFFGDAGFNPDIVWSSSGLGILMLEEGDGVRPLPGAEVTFSYLVKLKDGTEVDRMGKPTDARIGQMITGVSAGLLQMKGGGRALLFIPPKLGYGKRAFGPIPASSGLLFEVSLKSF